MSDSRTKNTARTMAAGLLNRLVMILFPFVNRTIIIYLLGAEYAGLSGLFQAILSVLSLAELGFNSAIVYSMYRPAAEGDTQQICRLLTLYRKLYMLVGSVILLGGLALVPFLPYLIQGDIPPDVSLYGLYFLYLADTVVSYFLFAYRESLLLAHQRRDISHMIATGVILLQYVAQAAVLLLWRNFYWYLMVTIVCTVVKNCAVALATRKRYPEYHCVPGVRVRLSDSMKKMVRALLIGNICDQARNSFDNIILSAYLGLMAVTIYSNYYLIYSSLYGIMLTVCTSMASSVGNSIATESVEKNYGDLRKFSFLAAWLSGWFAICMLCLYQPFMELWVGRTLMLTDGNMMLLCIYFYAINMNNVRNQYINGNGLWDRLKLTFAVEAAANIGLNLILGKLWGITGIILATILTIFFSNFLWRTWILFKTYFREMSLGRYLREHLYWALCVALTGGITWLVCSRIHLGTFAQLIVNGCICVVLPNVLLLLLFFRTEQFRAASSFVKQHLGRLGRA